MKGELIFNLNIFNIFNLYLLNAFIQPALSSLNGLLNSCSCLSDDKKSERVIFKRHDKDWRKKKQHRKKKDSYGHNHLPHLVNKEDKDYSSHSSGILQKVEKYNEHKHESASSYPHSIDKENKDSSILSGICKVDDGYHESKHDHSSSYPHSIDENNDEDSTFSCEISEKNNGNHNYIRSDCSCSYPNPDGNHFQGIGFPAPHPCEGI